MGVFGDAPFPLGRLEGFFDDAGEVGTFGDGWL